MEEKDVNSIANAVTNALAKLNADTAAKEKELKPQTANEQKEDLETFRCPECNAPVKGGIAFCQACGCPLEWRE
jgi:hypothetical protein